MFRSFWILALLSASSTASAQDADVISRATVAVDVRTTPSQRAEKKAAKASRLRVKRARVNVPASGVHGRTARGDYEFVPGC